MLFGKRREGRKFRVDANANALLWSFNASKKVETKLGVLKWVNASTSITLCMLQHWPGEAPSK